MRARLTARRIRLGLLALFVSAALGWAASGCGPQAGGQSGSEGCTPESAFATDARQEADARQDEDGGVEDPDSGADADTAFVASNPETNDAPRQCVVPEP